jgi:transcriptional regulator with XRE-family HTH domain
MGKEFAAWLNVERHKRNMSLRALAREAGVSPPTITLAANEGKVSAETCVLLARAFDMPVETVFRQAGLWDKEVNMPDSANSWGARLLALGPETRETAVRVMDSVLRTFERGH